MGPPFVVLVAVPRMFGSMNRSQAPPHGLGVIPIPAYAPRSLLFHLISPFTCPLPSYAYQPMVWTQKMVRFIIIFFQVLGILQVFVVKDSVYKISTQYSTTVLVPIVLQYNFFFVGRHIYVLKHAYLVKF